MSSNTYNVKEQSGEWTLGACDLDDARRVADHMITDAILAGDYGDDARREGLTMTVMVWPSQGGEEITFDYEFEGLA